MCQNCGIIIMQDCGREGGQGISLNKWTKENYKANQVPEMIFHVLLYTILYTNTTPNALLRFFAK